MHPVLIEIGPLSIRYYGLMYVLGIIAAIFLIRSEVRRKGLSFDRRRSNESATPHGFSQDYRRPASTILRLIGRSIANSCGRYQRSGEVGWPSMGG